MRCPHGRAGSSPVTGTLAVDDSHAEGMRNGRLHSVGDPEPGVWRSEAFGRNRLVTLAAVAQRKSTGFRNQVSEVRILSVAQLAES